MVFHDERYMAFPLTKVNREFWRGRHFMSKQEIMDAIGEWVYIPASGTRLVNLICDKLGPAVKQEAWYDTLDSERLAVDLMDASMTHGIIYIGHTMYSNNCIAISATPSGQTNIDADVMEAIMKKIGGGR